MDRSLHNDVDCREDAAAPVVQVDLQTKSAKTKMV